MTIINRLPTEVLVQIFSQLNKHNLKSCMYVCKKWQSPVTQTYYKEMDLHANQIYKMKTLLRDKTNQDAYLKKLQFTKKLTIQRDGDDQLKSAPIHIARIEDEGKEVGDNASQEIIPKSCKFEKVEFISLLSYLSNLQILHIEESRNCELYMTYLRDLDSALYLTRIKKIVGGGSGYNQDERKSYFATCYNFRASLSHLVLNYSRDAILTLNDRTGGVLSFLSDFDCLTHLEFNSGDDYYNSSYNLTVYDVQNTCPKFQSFIFRNSNNVSDEYVDTILAGFAVDEQERAISPLHIIKNNLKSLELQLPTLTSSYIELITRCSPTHLEEFCITLNEIDMYDWIAQTGWDSVLKLIQHMHLINTAKIQFRADKEYDSSLPRSDSRMTQFFKVFGALKGNRQNLFCTAQFSDFRSNYTTISMNGNKKVDLYYGIGYEDYGEYETTEEEAEEEEADHLKRISDAFAMPLPDIEKSLVGPEVINSLVFRICRIYPSIPYRLLKYALANCPHLQYFDLECLNTEYKIRLTSHHHIRSHHQTIKNDPSRTAQQVLKKIIFEGFSPTKEYLDLLASFLPNIETILCADQSYNAGCNDARKPTSFNFNLTAFPKLKSFRMDVQTVVDLKKNAFDYILVHLKYTDGNEAFYSIHNKTPYRMIPTSQQFILDCKQNQNLSTKLLTFECNKIEIFSLCKSDHFCIGELHFGELQEPITDIYKVIEHMDSRFC